MIVFTTAVWAGDRPSPYTEEWRARIKKAHDALAHDGMRVLGLAFRIIDAPEKVTTEEVDAPPDGKGDGKDDASKDDIDDDAPKTKKPVADPEPSDEDEDDLP
mgnify:CR=1 FL=1